MELFCARVLHTSHAEQTRFFHINVFIVFLQRRPISSWGITF